MTCIRTLIPVLLLLSLAIIAGCSSTPRGGGYYKDDGPGNNIPANIEAIPDAVPRIEQHSRANFRPYVVFGKKYFPVSDEAPFRQQGTASWYGRKFHGQKTANGETYDMYGMTAAHPTLPLPSYARVTHAKTGKSVIVRVNDRGPFHSTRIIDLSYVAAAKLGLIGPGSGQVIVEAITNADIRRGLAGTPKAAPIPAAQPPEPKSTLTAQATTPDALAALETIRIGPEPMHGSAAANDASRVDTPATDNTGASTSRGASADVARSKVPIPGVDMQLVDAPEADTSTSDPSAGAGATQVYLQFGAFSSSQTAHQLAQKLNGQIGQTENLQAVVRSGANLHRVQMGPFASRTLAVNAAVRIQQQTGMQPAIALR
ncbi:MAG TPA: septal ring lytic transglycosylase RlpA family protein [Burkholderiaceae bacterium]|nr:septal ring lytic transglycosylase RlpA family protein [Burkholderiaceae bacterium]